jgi:hypothetical protein
MKAGRREAPGFFLRLGGDRVGFFSGFETSQRQNLPNQQGLRVICGEDMAALGF